jgi:hypothetical protein
MAVVPSTPIASVFTAELVLDVAQDRLAELRGRWRGRRPGPDRRAPWAVAVVGVHDLDAELDVADDQRHHHHYDHRERAGHRDHHHHHHHHERLAALGESLGHEPAHGGAPGGACLTIIRRGGDAHHGLIVHRLGELLLAQVVAGRSVAP